MELKVICQEFVDRVHSIHGLYIDIVEGFIRWRNENQAEQNKLVQRIKTEHGPDHPNVRDPDSIPIIYSQNWPEDRHFNVLHRSTLGDVLCRLGADGEDYRLTANVCIVMIYQWWEDEYRGRIADYLHRPKSEIRCDIMGDLRHLRSSIIPKNGLAVDEVSGCKVLKWFKPGDTIVLTRERFTQLIDAIYSGMEAFYMDALTL